MSGTGGAGCPVPGPHVPDPGYPIGPSPPPAVPIGCLRHVRAPSRGRRPAPGKVPGEGDRGRGRQRQQVPPGSYRPRGPPRRSPLPRAGSGDPGPGVGQRARLEGVQPGAEATGAGREGVSPCGTGSGYLGGGGWGAARGPGTAAVLRHPGVPMPGPASSVHLSGSITRLKIPAAAAGGGGAVRGSSFPGAAGASAAAAPCSSRGSPGVGRVWGAGTATLPVKSRWCWELGHVLLSVPPSLCPSLCLSLHPFLLLSICLSIPLSIPPSVPPSLCLSLHLPLHPSLLLSLCPSIPPPVPLSVPPSVHLLSGGSGLSPWQRKQPPGSQTTAGCWRAVR